MTFSYIWHRLVWGFSTDPEFKQAESLISWLWLCVSGNRFWHFNESERKAPLKQQSGKSPSESGTCNSQWHQEGNPRADVRKLKTSLRDPDCVSICDMIMVRLKKKINKNLQEKREREKEKKRETMVKWDEIDLVLRQIFQSNLRKNLNLDLRGCHRVQLFPPKNKKCLRASLYITSLLN